MNEEQFKRFVASATLPELQEHLRVLVAADHPHRGEHEESRESRRTEVLRAEIMHRAGPVQHYDPRRPWVVVVLERARGRSEWTRTRVIGNFTSETAAHQYAVEEVPFNSTHRYEVRQVESLDVTSTH